MGSVKKITDNKHYNVYQRNNSGMFVAIDFWTVGKEDWTDEYDFSTNKKLAHKIANDLDKIESKKIRCKCGKEYQERDIPTLPDYEDAAPLCTECYDELELPDFVKLPDVIKITGVTLSVLKRHLPISVFKELEETERRFTYLGHTSPDIILQEDLEARFTELELMNIKYRTYNIAKLKLAVLT